MDDALPQPLPPDELAVRRRVSDAEREDVADLMRTAAGDGRLSFVELEERLEQVYNAKTYGELVEVSKDLPGGPELPSAQQEQLHSTVPAARPGGVLQRASNRIQAFLSETKRTGPWLAPQNQEIRAVLGDVTLDYTEADVPYDEVYVDALAVLSDVKIRVPSNAVVHLDGSPVLGSVSEQGSREAGDADAGRPTTFHIKGTAILGEIKVRRGPTLGKRLSRGLGL